MTSIEVTGPPGMAWVWPESVTAVRKPLKFCTARWLTSTSAPMTESGTRTRTSVRVMSTQKFRTVRALPAMPRTTARATAIPVAAATEVVEEAGHFRVYLGAAAGVGKTYAMLNEGQRRRGRGADVVIGFVECHGRRLTEQLIDGLEVVPRKVVDYRGSRLEEMDLDAVLRRRPKIALVDELAHTNVPGSGRHDKRWQDVMDILAAGINVITTVNIQHLESIADEVEHVTGARVRERVPDWVVRNADQIDLVDSSPEQPRRRMLHGNTYPKARDSPALSHFLRTDNLIALPH